MACAACGFALSLSRKRQIHPGILPMQTRRQFSASLLGSLAAYGLLETLFRRDLFADAVKPTVHKWLVELNDLSKDLKDQKLKDTDFQAKLEELYRRCDLPDLLKLID